MKLYIKRTDNVFGMANLNPQKSGLPVVIWSDHGGVSRNKADAEPGVKITKDGKGVSVSIQEKPEILARSPKLTRSEMSMIQKGLNT